MEKKNNLIIGIGSGRCGTYTLYKLLSLNMQAYHEAYIKNGRLQPLPWKQDKWLFKMSHYKIAQKAKEDLGIVAFYYLNYIDLFYKYFHHKFSITVIHLWREPEETAISFDAIANDMWARPTRKSPYYHCFPNYTSGNKLQRIERYVRTYHSIVKNIRKKYKGKISFYEYYYKDFLNNKNKQKDFLKKAGISSPKTMTHRAYNDKLLHFRKDKDESFSDVGGNNE